MRTGWIVGILFVLVAAAAIPASAAVTSQSDTYLSISVSQTDPVKTNDFNYVTIKLDPKTSYPTSARIIILPSYFSIKPDWVKGCDAIKTGSGVTCTLWNMQDERTIKIIVPSSVLEGLNFEDNKVQLIKEVRAYTFTSSAATAYGVETKNLAALSVVAPESFVSYDNPFEAFFPVLLIFIGVGLTVLGAKFLS